MSWLGDQLERIGNLPVLSSLLKFDARNITEASKVGQKVFGDNAIGHMFDWGRREGEQNQADPGRQFRKGVEFYGKALAGQYIGQAIGGFAGAGAETGGTGATVSEGGGSVDQALAGWGTSQGGAYAGSEDWSAAGGAAGAAGSDALKDWGKPNSQYPGSDQWSAPQATDATKATSEKSVMKDIGRSVAIGAGTNVVTSLLTPKPKQPAITPPPPMPDQQAMEQERRRKIAEQMARRGRAASILTDAGY